MAWHDQAVAAFKSGDFQAAAHAWTFALMKTPISNVSDRIRFLRARSKAMAKLNCSLFALDDIETVLRLEPYKAKIEDLIQFEILTERCALHQEAMAVCQLLAAKDARPGKCLVWTTRSLQLLELIERSTTATRTTTASEPSERKVQNMEHWQLTSSQEASLTRAKTESSPAGPVLVEGYGSSWRDLCPFQSSAAVEPAMPGEAIKQLAASGLEVKFQAGSGNGLFATRSFAPKTLIWTEKPFLYASIDEGECFLCARQVVKKVYCQHCQFEWYCSMECCVAAFQLYHKPLCGVDYAAQREEIRSTGFSTSSRSQLLFFKFLGWLVLQQATETSLTPLPALSNWWIQQWLQSLRTSAAQGRPRILSIPQIRFHCKKWRSLAPTAVWTHSQILNSATYIAAMEIGVMYSFCVANKEDRRLNRMPSGVALFHQASFANHSCMPNVEWIIDPGSNQIRLVALRDLAPGEELFLSYINHKVPFEQRQQSLFGYGFTCRCPKCLLKL